MLLVFGCRTFFYQIINIKVLNNFKTKNIFKSILKTLIQTSNQRIKD